MIKKNFLYSLIYQLLVIMLSLVTTPYLSRVLGAEAIGRYAYAHSITNYFLLFTMLGIPNLGNRSVAAVKGNRLRVDKVFSAIFRLQLLLFAVTSAGYILYCALYAPDRSIASILYLYLLSALFDISWLFFGLEEFKLTITRNIIIKVMTAVCMFVYVKTPEHIYRYCLLISLGTLLNQAYLWLFVRNYATLKWEKPFVSNQYLQEICVLFIPILSLSVYKVMSKIMIGAMSTYSQLGFFENSERIITIPVSIFTALGAVMLPRISNMLSQGGEQEASKYFRLSIKFVSFVGAAIAFGLMGTSDIFSIVYFGEAFAACGNIIACLSCSVIFMAWANVIRTQYLIPKKRDKVYIISTLIGACLNFVVNCILIPRLGSLGAAIGTVLAEAAVMVIQAFLIRREINIFELVAKEIPQLLIGAVMMLAIRAIGQHLPASIGTLCIQVFSGAVIYLSLMLIYSIATRDEMLTIFRKKHSPIHEQHPKR